MMRRQTGQRGVSLIEAIVALGVMAFGMLAVVGVQATLRGSGDLARQRTEAMRIAQETMENNRTYTALTGTAGQLDFSEITSRARSAVVVAGTALENRLNTTFYSTITAPALTNSAAMAPVAVTVDWTDRSGQFQAIELRSLIAGVPPELAGSLALPAAREAFAAPRGRHRNVPLSAFSLPGVGLSVFKPPQGSGGTVAWVFNNLTGLVTGLCDVAGATTNENITSTQAQSCVDNRTSTTAQMITGYVRFADGDPTANNQAEDPTGTIKNLDVALTLTSSHPSAPICFDDATNDSPVAQTRREVAYYCLIYSNADGTFAGRTRIRPLAFSSGSAWNIDDGNSDFKVCRYTPLRDNGNSSTPNWKHPLDYTTNGGATGARLSNQNFLVIGGAFGCPSETPVAGDLFNANTWLHQDNSSTYNNP